MPVIHTAHIAQAVDSDLLDGVYGSVGHVLSRSQMARLVYNTLNGEIKDGGGQIYAQSIGYTVSTDELSLGDVISNDAEGPVTFKDSNLSQSSGTSMKVYRNGQISSLDALQEYDVVYYSQSSQRIWAYSEKVTGILESKIPNLETPTSITVSGQKLHPGNPCGSKGSVHRWVGRRRNGYPSFR